MTALLYVLAIPGGFLAAYGLLLLSAACGPTGGGDGSALGSGAARRGVSPSAKGSLPVPSEKCSDPGRTPRVTHPPR